MYYPTATINFKNFRHNIKYIQALSKSAELFPVIKANAYGHGYAEIAKILSEEPQALQLRYLQTLTNISEEKNSTVIFLLV